MIRAFLPALAAWAGLACPAAFAQEWPAGPVRIVVPFTPGTGMDILARTVGPKLSAMWGQPVVVENKPGASGNIGTFFVVKSPPDGLTLMMGASTVVMNLALYKDMPYDPIADLAPVGLATKASMLLVVHPKLGIRSAKALVDRSKEHPGTLNYASPGVGTPHHLAMELFKARSGADLTHVPFSGTGPAVTQLLGGEVPVMFLPVHVAIAQVKAGKLDALATGGASRSPLAPDVPTLGELGYRDSDTDIWYALWAPAKTPPALVARIDADLQKALAMPDVRDALTQQGMEVTTSTPEELGRRMREDAARWAAVVHGANIKAQ